MLPSPIRRALAAGALAIYGLASLVLLPVHHIEWGAPRPGPEGVFVAAGCPDRDCHDPAHRHSGGHVHDPATCVSCVQARAAESPAPAGPSLACVRAVRTAAPAAPSAAARSVPRGLPSARAPPALSA